MRNYRHGRPTIGVLAGWHAYEGTLHSFLDQVLRGILAAARDRACNLLLACGVGTGEPGQGRPAWPPVRRDPGARSDSRIPVSVPGTASHI